MAQYIYYTVVDEKGDQSTVELPVDAASLADLALAVGSAAPIVKALLTGGLVRAGFRVDVAIASGVWSPIATAGSDLQEKAFFSFRTAGGYAKTLNIPTILESIFSTGTRLVNQANTAVANFVTMMEDGFSGGTFTGQVDFTDYRGDDIEALSEAREAWGKYRRG